MGSPDKSEQLRASLARDAEAYFTHLPRTARAEAVRRFVEVEMARCGHPASSPDRLLDPGPGGPLTDLGLVVLAALVASAVACGLTWAVLP